MKWIKCSDELPKVGELVLTYSDYGYVVASIDDSGKWNAKDADYETGEPWLRGEESLKNWAKLPSPPVVS